jgi:hypothetical protein
MEPSHQILLQHLLLITTSRMFVLKVLVQLLPAPPSPDGFN